MSKARELASLGNAYSDGALSNRNLIINGAMQVAQRGTSYTLNSNGYTLDRWKTVSIHGQQTVAQQAVTDLAGFSKCIRVQRDVGSTANAYSIELNQPVESLNTTSVVGKTVTLSFWARVGSDYSGDVDAFTSTIAYHNYTGVDMGMEEGDFLATFASTKVVQANTPSTDWTYYTMTADIASDAYQVGIVIATQSWVGTAGANDYFEVTGVQLEVGDTATPFEHRSIGQELALCERYLQTLPVGGGAYTSILGYDDATAVVNLRQTMRASPSLLSTGITGYGSGNTEYRVYIMSNGGGGFAGSPASANFFIDYSTPTKVRIRSSIASGWYNSTFEHTGAFIDVGAGCKVLLDAEL